MSEAVARLPLAALGASTGFHSDARFVIAELPPPPPEPEPDPEDPVALAYAEGYAAGAADARAQADEQARIKDEAREALALSIARLDQEMVEDLEFQLREAVAALCESTIAPLALDEASLLPRIKRAAAMLARTEDERLIRLNPDDLAFVSPKLLQDWRVQSDTSLPRGTIRVEAANGGVEDSPEQWRHSIREALDQC